MVGVYGSLAFVGFLRGWAQCIGMSFSAIEIGPGFLQCGENHTGFDIAETAGHLFDPIETGCFNAPSQPIQPPYEFGLAYTNLLTDLTQTFAQHVLFTEIGMGATGEHRRFISYLI